MFITSSTTYSPRCQVSSCRSNCNTIHCNRNNNNQKNNHKNHFFSPCLHNIVAHTIHSKSSTYLFATSTTTSTTTDNPNRRTYQTKADLYFQQYGTIPKPIVMHANLEQLLKDDQRILGDCTTSTSPSSSSNNNNNILIIGDIHGCLNELKTLVQKAKIKYNNNKPFRCIILVGDLCNKGPYSTDVIKYVKEQRGWFTVRGNHDDGALAAALGDEERRMKKRYAWIFDNRDQEEEKKDEEEEFKRDNSPITSVSSLSDEDVEWLSNIPYTITIPKSFWTMEDQGRGSHYHEEDVIVVHAGLIPNVQLQDQDIKTMVTIRDVVHVHHRNHSNHQQHHTDETKDEYTSKESIRTKPKYEYYDRYNKENQSGDIYPWAKVWNGPQLVIFGHDAKRGLQKENFAIGLDTGCTYGNALSGIILPSKSIVSVVAERVHCPISKKQ